jgi:hypothetical protein
VERGFPNLTEITGKSDRHRRAVRAPNSERQLSTAPNNPDECRFTPIPDIKPGRDFAHFPSTSPEDERKLARGNEVGSVRRPQLGREIRLDSFY